MEIALFIFFICTICLILIFTSKDKGKLDLRSAYKLTLYSGCDIEYDSKHLVSTYGGYSIYNLKDKKETEEHFKNIDEAINRFLEMIGH